MVMLTSLPATHHYDICVIGTGPVGLTLALEAAARGMRVLMLESGSAEPDDASADAAHANVVNPQTHAPMALATSRVLGGSSWLWGGRCVPFEAIDLEPRDYVQHSGWPLALEQIAPWYGKAADYLDCGSARFRQPAARWPAMAEIELSQLERWARQPKLAPRLGQRVLNTPGIDILFDATVNGMNFTCPSSEGASRVTSLSANHQKNIIKVHAAEFVLAGGGLESTRLLLAVQQDRHDLFGGIDGPLGRYYMGHIFGSIASIVLTDPDDFGDLDFAADDSATYVRRRFTLSAAAQRQHQLLNTSFFADNPPFYDQRHRNPTLSMVFLALSIPALGRRMISEAIRLRHIGPPPYHYGAHLLNILRRPWQAIADIMTILRLRYLSAVRKPGFVLRNQGGTYALNYHAEQVPNPDSRVTLQQERDRHGLPRLNIDFRYLPQDAQSVLQAHELLDNNLRATGKGRLDYHRAAPQRLAHIMEQATDGFHQAGTTRMHEDPQLGVVDRDCRVHGISNLHIASSSVFTTTGEANPTFLAVALAARLGNHLADRHHGTSSAPPTLNPSGFSRMQSTQLPGTTLELSRLSFGTASLHHLFKSQQRQSLLREAIDAGFTHFDTSPYYGFGLAEKSLGELPPSLRQQMTVASKVGLYGPHGAGSSVPEILLRKVAGKALPGLNKAVVDWSLTQAKKSLQQSLRRLQRDRLDILFLHEPVQSLIVSDEWQAWLESLIQAGTIRHYGIAGEAALISAMLEKAPELAPIVQMRDSLQQHQADLLTRHGRPLQMTYGYLAAGNNDGVDGTTILRQALQRNATGSILVSTRRIERVATLAQAAN